MSHLFSTPSLPFRRKLVLFLTLSVCLAAPAHAMGFGNPPEADEEFFAFSLIVLETLLTLLVEPFLLTYNARMRFGIDCQIRTSTAFLALFLALLQVLFVARIAFDADTHVFHLTARLIGWSPHMAKSLLALHCVGYLAVHQGFILLAVSRLAAPLPTEFHNWLERRAWQLLMAPLVLFAWLGLVSLHEKSPLDIADPDLWRQFTLALLVVAVLGVTLGLPRLYRRMVAWQPAFAGTVWLVAPLAAFVVLDRDGRGSSPSLSDQDQG
jgi:hypothetical protein